MQIAINPNIYGAAQVYAEKRGVDLSAVIEDFLVRYVHPEQEPAPQIRRSLKEFTPRVASLVTGRRWELTDEQLEQMRMEYIAEKYK